MTESMRGSGEDALFRVLVNNGYEEGLTFLFEAAGAMPRARRESLGVEGAAEFCLPLALSVPGVLCWTERVSMISGANGLGTFLHHCVSKVPFYQRLLGARLDEPLLLGDFPIISKEIILRNYASFISEDYYSAPWKFFKPTSATTGTPLIVWYDLESFYELNYVTYRRIAERLPGFFDALLVGQTSVVQVTDDPSTWCGSTVLPSLRFTRLVRQVFGIEGLDDRHALARVERLGPRLICGLATSLLAFADLEQRTPDVCSKISPTALFLSGEILYEDTRTRLQAHFGCQVINGYASSEGGLIALECGCASGMHIVDHVRLELLTDRDEIVTEGEGEILITNLMNWALPFVRYRTGDRAVVRRTECACGIQGQTITALYGRDTPRFHLRGNIVETSELDRLLTALPIKEFRVRQDTADTLTFAWAPGAAPVSAEEIELSVEATFRRYADGLVIRFEREEMLTRPGTKRRRYVVAASSELTRARETSLQVP